MPFDPTLAAIRFGMGLSPLHAPPAGADEMLAWLSGPDEAAQIAPIPPYSQATPSLNDLRLSSRRVNDLRGTDQEQAARDARDAMREAAREAVISHIRSEMVRHVHARDGLRERLVRFWGDHFTARATGGGHRHLISPYHEEAIRPHVTGNFGDMLVAVIGSPMMILYLDQHQSMGPNSPTARNRDRGMNENLAREALELHTLGVGGSYTQEDVRQFAELLTGVTTHPERGGFFRVQQAEPGAETILGRTYGGGEESLDHVHAALRDLAVHPDTARHLARKLVVHFIGGAPDAALVEAMAAAYLDRGGELMALYEVMLNAEAAWSPDLRKVKLPFEFITSSLRALAVPQEALLSTTMQDIRRTVERPLSVMGQVWQQPVGPDGWPEDPEAWITPQGMAGRISWALEVPRQYLADLPDPRDFVFDALGPTPPEAVIFAAGAAETVHDGIGVILASAAFQRR